MLFRSVAGSNMPDAVAFRRLLSSGAIKAYVGEAVMQIISKLDESDDVKTVKLIKTEKTEGEVGTLSPKGTN